jgi:hypothetical protein
VKIRGGGLEDLGSEGASDESYGERSPQYDAIGADDTLGADAIVAYGGLTTPTGADADGEREDRPDVERRWAELARNATSSTSTEPRVHSSTSSTSSPGADAIHRFPMMSRHWHDIFVAQWDAARPSERQALQEKWSRQLTRSLRLYWAELDAKKEAEEAKQIALGRQEQAVRPVAKPQRERHEYTKLPRESSLAVGQSLHAWVGAKYTGRHTDIKKEQRGRDGDTGLPCSYLFAYCKECEQLDGSPCRFAAKYVALPDGKVKQYESGVHGVVRSRVSRAAERKQMVKRMASSSEQPSEQRKKALREQRKKAGDAGKAADIVPSASSIYQEKSKKRKAEDMAHGGSSPTEFEEAMLKRQPKTEDPVWKLQFDAGLSKLSRNFAVLRCRGLAAEGKKFMQRTRTPLNLVCDATHNFGVQKWKLLALGFVGVHWRNNEWTKTFMPLGFAIARTETAEAASALCEAVLSEMMELDVDLEERIDKVYLDGGLALKKALRHNFPAADIRRCLEHLKKDIRTGRGAWRKELNVKRLVWLVEETAYMPLRIFSLVWLEEIAKLKRQHGEQSLAARYLMKNLFWEREDGLLDAEWRSTALDAPYSTYTNNVIESFWLKYETAHGRRPLHRDIVNEVDDLEDCVYMWLDDGDYDFVHPELIIAGKEAFKASPALRGGSEGGEGKPATFTKPPDEEKGAVKKTIRRLTARGIIGMAMEGPFAVYKEIGTQRCWACPKYDPDKFDEGKLTAFMRLLCDDDHPSQDDLAMFDIRLGVGDDGSPLFHASAVVNMMREYTLLTLEEGTLMETHRDFIEHGQTEHILWVQQMECWKDHCHMPEGKAKAKAKRRTHAKAKPMASPEPQAKPKARPRGRPKKAAAPPAGSIDIRDCDLPRALEESGLEFARRASLEENSADKARREEEEARMAERLTTHGARRITTNRHGNCQFIAIVETAGLDESPFDWRQRVCAEMTRDAARYRDSINEQDYGGGDFNAYVAEMRKDGAWGDALTLHVAATILKRPFRVVRLEGDPFTVEPHEGIPATEWGETILLAHYGERHYEGTAPLEVAPAA